MSEIASPVTFVLWASLAVICGLSGPLGTYVLLPLGWRMLVWGFILALALLIGIALRSFVHARLGLRDFWRGSSLIALLATLLLTLPFNAMAQVLFSSEPMVRPNTGEIGAFIFCVSLAVGAYRHIKGLYDPGSTGGGVTTLVPPDPATPDAALAQPPEQDHPRIVQRLEPQLRGRLISVSVRDHYVDVLTDRGQGSLLMRLSDAIAETEGEAGAQIHRSHWVAFWAAQGLERAEGKVQLVLISGKRLPVSRNNRAKLDPLALRDYAEGTAGGSASGA